jgi:dihydroorotate dehydrogenase
MFYQFLFKNVFARMDPEQAHHLVMFVIRFSGAIGLTRLARLKPTGRGAVQAFGLHFDAPFGLAAGFDKNALAIRALGDLGFSHVEIGTVTAIPQSGNDKPRLFRLIEDRALINRMGFNNQGAEVVAKRLAKLRDKNGSKLPVIGVNIGKSRVVDVENAVEDYRTSARLLAKHADYVAVNVSSPNTPGLRSLQSVEALRPILQAVQGESAGKPILVKIAPDLADEDVVAVADLAVELGLAGVIATNTTKRSIEVLQILAKHLDGRAAIISVGGIETGAEAEARLAAGATLVQGYSGYIYEGPFWARKVNKHLTK